MRWENVRPSVGRLQMVYLGDTMKQLPCSSYLNERPEIAKRCDSLGVLSAPWRVNTRPALMQPRLFTAYSTPFDLFYSRLFFLLFFFKLFPITSLTVFLRFRLNRGVCYYKCVRRRFLKANTMREIALSTLNRTITTCLLFSWDIKSPWKTRWNLTVLRIQ